MGNDTKKSIVIQCYMLLGTIATNCFAVDTKRKLTNTQNITKYR
jgi:hypothetical protein